MANYLHPGIYIEEIPSVRSIQGAPTSVAAFVGVTEIGPINTPTLITSWNAYTRQFGNLLWYGMNTWAVYEFFIEGGASCYIVRAGDLGNGKAATATLPSSGSGTKMNAASVGDWGNAVLLSVSNNSTTNSSSGGKPAQSPVFNLQVVVEAQTIDSPGTSPSLATQMLIAYVTQNGLTTISINNQSYYVLESFNGFTDAGASFVSRINTHSMFIRVGETDGKRPNNTASPTKLQGGANANWDLVGGMNTLKTIQGVSLLAVPDTVTITKNGVTDTATQSQVINQGLSLCQDLGSLFYATDPPYGQNVQNIVAFKSGTMQNGQALNSSYGALYYPWAWIFNPLSNSNVPIPPSGPSLGRYAYTDGTIGVWKSPAGVNDGAMRSVVSLALPLTDADQDTLNPNGINSLRNLINYGNVIYGARTVSQDTQWTYLSVRRLFIFVEQSLKNSLQWVVFEPNDQQLWAGVTRDVSAFLNTLWQQGALFGATPQEAFFVTCDASNNPPETRMLGQLYIDIGLAPVYPAEFVVIRITQKTAGPDSGS